MKFLLNQEVYLIQLVVSDFDKETWLDSLLEALGHLHWQQLPWL